MQVGADLDADLGIESRLAVTPGLLLLDLDGLGDQCFGTDALDGDRLLLIGPPRQIYRPTISEFCWRSAFRATSDWTECLKEQ